MRSAEIGGVRRIGAAFALAGILVLASPAITAEPVPQAKIDNFLLGNGMEVVVIPDHRSPIVTHMVWYKIGSADEPAGKSGIAHFFEHLMFKGTTNHKAGEFGARIAVTCPAPSPRARSPPASRSTRPRNSAPVMTRPVGPSISAGAPSSPSRPAKQSSVIESSGIVISARPLR